MNKDNQYIDHLFEQELMDFAPEPGGDLWKAISAKLDAKDMAIRRRKAIIRWTSFSAAVVAVAIFLFVRSCSVSGTDSLHIVKKRTERIHVGSENVVIAARKSSFSPQPSIENQSPVSNSNTIVKDKNIVVSARSNPSRSKAKKSTDLPLNAQGESSDFSSIEMLNRTAAGQQRIDFSRFAALQPNASYEVRMFESIPYFIFKSQKSIGIQAEAGAGLMFLSANSSPVFSDEMPIIKTAQPFNSPVSDFFVNLKFQYSHFYGKLGLSVSQYYQKNSYSIPYTTMDTSGGYASFDLNKYWTYDTVGYFHDPYDPDILYPIVNPTYHIDTVGMVWNSKFVENQNIKNTKSSQAYHFVEIPISIGYQHQIGKVGIFGDVGLGFAFLYKSTGFYSDGLNYFEITSEINPFRKTHANLILNAGISYPLGNKWNIFAQGSYRTNISAIYQLEQLKDVRFNAYGLRFGLSYNLK
ncbi:MAG: hypothetical protein JXR34_03365 [Bacteroidales bacterium]|nr:hypothetical protein [Bacteroidales bacterium]